MLSRQIDNSSGKGADGYQDGAERLERKRSLSKPSGSGDPNLHDLEALVGNGLLIQRLSLEGQSQRGDEVNGDLILPSVPGSSLKRSTRTTYRRGSTKTKNDRLASLAASKRVVRGASSPTDDASTEVPSVPDVPTVPSVPPEDISKPLQALRGASPPTVEPSRSTNFSRPAGRTPSPPQATTFDSILSTGSTDQKSSSLPQSPINQWQSHLPAENWQKPPERQPIPQIVETPPPPEPSQARPYPTAISSASPLSTSVSSNQVQNRLPERTSSREEPKPSVPQKPTTPINQGTSNTPNRPNSRGSNMEPPTHSLDQMSSHPSPMPGTDTNTGSLSFIPTLTEDKKADNKKVKDKKDETRKSSWGWLRGREETDKDKRSESSKPKAKITKPQERHDNTRLDVLQTSIDGGSKGRESLVLDRESLKLEEERKKESQRKSTGSDTKKEKDGLFSSLFSGVKKHKADKDSSKKFANRGLSPEPPYRELKPDVDYNWTRFTILEERAIYRMAHIKLANPRRALYSQVLLSNFMYSYLAKVQQMHPQMNLPTSAKQQKKQQQQQEQEQQTQQAQLQQQAVDKDQPDEFTQYQRYQQVGSIASQLRCEIY